MKRDEILDRVKGIFQKSSYYYMSSLLESIEEATSLIDDLSMDSIQILEFIVDVEEEFGIKFNFELLCADDISNISQVIDLIGGEPKKGGIRAVRSDSILPEGKKDGREERI